MRARSLQPMTASGRRRPHFESQSGSDWRDLYGNERPVLLSFDDPSRARRDIDNGGRSHDGTL